MKKTKVGFYATPEMMDNLNAMAKKFGVKRPQVVILAINAGLDVLQLTFDPDWKQVFEKLARDYEAISKKYENNGESSIEPIK